jgi:hypothetical protein
VLIGAEGFLAVFTGQTAAAPGGDSASASSSEGSWLSSLRSAECMLAYLGAGGGSVGLLRARLLTALLAPPLFVAAALGLLALAPLVLRLCRWRRRQAASSSLPPLLQPATTLADRAVVVALVVLTAQQFTVTLVFLEVLSCTDVNGVSHLAVNTLVVCGR